MRGNDYSTTSSSWFSLYGLRKFPHFYIAAVRHVISPKFSFSYNPDFSKNSRFYSFGDIGLNKSSKKRTIGYSLENKWQLKLTETEQKKERKINDFFRINSSISYNFEDESDRKFSDISHTIDLNPNDLKFKYFSLSLNPGGKISQKTYELKVNDWNPQNWNYAIKDWNFDITSKLTISGDANYFEYFPQPENRFVTNKFFHSDSLSDENENLLTTIADIEKLDKEQKNWSVTFSHTYRTDKEQYEDKDYYSYLRSSVSAKITRNWTIAYNNNYDIEAKDLKSHNFTLTRELHCWKLVFTYTKQDDYWNYKFMLFNIKLPDSLKFRTSDHKK